MNKTALIVVDMQNDFITGVLGTEEAVKIVPGFRDFVEGFDGDLYFTQDTHQSDYLNTVEGKKLPVTHCIEGSEGWEIIPELKPFTEKAVVIKKPGFGSLELAELLKEKNYDSILICGVCTGICVITNALLIKAALPNTPITVYEDLCACVTPESHKNAVEAMKLCHIDFADSTAS